MNFFSAPALTRRASGLAWLGLAAALAAPAPALAQAQAQDKYPSRVIKVIVPFPAGTAPDVMARFWGERLSKALGQGVVVDNKPGASTIVGTQQFVAAPADGYTLLYTASGTVSINPFAYKKLPYQVADLVPVIQTLSIPLVVSVANASPYKTLSDLIKDAKDHPNKVSYASYGVATAPHVSMAYLANSANISLNHVPYKGTQQSIPDIISGQVALLFDNVMTSQPNIKAGKVKGLAISSSARSPLAPELPTIAETGLPGFQSTTWFGLLGPASTPKAVVERVNAEMNKALALPDIQARFAQMGFEPAGGTAAEFAQVIQRDAQKWSKVIKDAGVKAE